MTTTPDLGRPQARTQMVALLEAAAARLRDKGWQRGEYGPPSGPNCIMGALHWAARQEDVCAWAARTREAQEVLVRHLHCDPACWNDTICPDGAAAIDALLMTAKELAGEEAP